MKNLLFVALIFLSNMIFAQTTVTWIGGAPGNETNWDDARNWSNNRVPDELSNVIIKELNTGHAAQPEIKGNVEVLSVEIHGGATLTVEQNAELLIDGAYSYTEGIKSYGGQLVNNGYIELKNIDSSVIAVLLENREGHGIVVVNDQLLENEGFAFRK